MYEFKDPSGAARAAIVAVAIYLAAETVFGLVSILMLIAPDPFYEGEFDTIVSAMAGLAVFAGLVGSVILVGRWTYRVNANAHTMSDDLTITPGWAVGWHFVPIANLFKPFQAMKETWMATHYRADWYGEPTPPLLAWWWGLWIVTNILANISVRIELASDGYIPDAVFLLDAATGVLNVPLCLLLIRMIRQLSAAQLTARHDETFA